MSTWNLSAIGVILLGDSKKSDGRHEGGHQGESNRSDLGRILNNQNNYFLTWQLFIQQFKGLPPLRHLRVNIHCWFSGAPHSAWWVFPLSLNPSLCGFSFWSPVTCHYMKWTPRTSFSRATCSRVRWQRIWEGQWRGRDSRVERIGLVAHWNSFFFFSLFVVACLSLLGPCLSCFKDMFRWFQWYGGWRIWGWL